ncbi:AraC family transcriptional regulator [Mameliella alba]|nr:AraC family transcriptional regulator [Antarctobacter heliothermus]MBY6145666.1 AraC family transcriptional regulator [Mameliella alba]MCA0954917.1 AraC family transcriptional regulator [Mameliella alba]
MSFAEDFAALRTIYSFPQAAGVVETYMPQVRFFWATEPVPRAPLLYDTGIVVIGQGHKIGHWNGQSFRYDRDHYLVSSLPTALECETCASPEEPILGIFIDIDTPRLHQMIERVERHAPDHDFNGHDILAGIEPVRMNVPMQQAVERLLHCLRSKLDSDVLGPAILEEITFRALLDDHGTALAALTRQDTHHARIARALSYLQENYSAAISVEALAEQANMSASAFHRAFKTVTGESPLQYQKKLRLNRARQMILREGLRVGTAANRVGYESVSQFSREFKRYFDVPPSAAQDGAYAEMFR